MSSLEIREARENIINYLNNSSLATEAKRLVVLEILGQLESVAEQEILLQLKEREKVKKEEKEVEGKEGEADD